MQITPKRLYISLLLISILCSLSIIILFYARSIKIIEVTSKEKLKNILSEHSIKIENNLENTELLSHTLKELIKTTIPYENIKNDNIALKAYKNDISELFVNTIKIFNARSGWVVFDDHVIDNGGSIFYAKESNTYTKQEEFNISTTEYINDSWWIDAIKNNDTWSDLYYWKHWDSPIISYSEALNIGETTIGVVGSDVFFEDIYEQLNSIKIYKTGYVTLLNSDYNILYNPNNDIIGENYALLNDNQYFDVVEKIKAGGDFDIIEFYDGDTEKIIGYQKINNGWILIAHPNKYEMYDDLNKLNFVLIIVIILIIVLVQVFEWHISKIKQL